MKKIVKITQGFNIQYEGKKSSFKRASIIDNLDSMNDLSELQEINQQIKDLHKEKKYEITGILKSKKFLDFFFSRN